jgi:glutaredoxin 3
MAAVTVYTRPLCPYCVRAVSLLKKKGVAFDEIDAGFDVKKKQEMIQRADGARTFPQIFIGDIHVGGCDEMMALERAGKLDDVLREQGAA